MDPVLAQKIEQANLVIEEAFENFAPENTIIAWSAGKDSTLLLKLIQEYCKKHGIKEPDALDIDQNNQIEELLKFRDQLVLDWNINLKIVKNINFLELAENIGDEVRIDKLNIDNQNALQEIDYNDASIRWIPDSPVCNHLLKTKPINRLIQDNGYQALFTGIRWDEHVARENESYFSPRQDPEHTRIHPLLHFTERDIWNATFALPVPHSELYQQGYRSLGTKFGTKKFSDLPAWQQDLENSSEREHRSKEKEQMMQQLRAWGYM